MADSLLHLGTEPVFPFHPNWSSTPSTKMALSRLVLRHPGTVQTLTSLTDYAPQSFGASFTLYTKEEESTMLDFIHNSKGKVNRFWVFHPKNSFKLKYTVASGGNILICYPNRAYSSYQGYERIWIKMNDGDILTRQVTSVTYDSALDEMSVNLSGNLDRELTVLNHNLIGQVLLVRFEDDEFTVSMVTDTVSKIKLNFFELVKEYSLI